MALREVRTIGDPILWKVCKEVKTMTPRTLELIDDMFETMHAENGVGLAAPQVGILKRIVVIEVEDGEPYTLINPRIVFSEGEQTGYEGCLSIPGKSGVVTRPDHVICEALDENMEPYTIDAHELLARCICHELDHLDGHLYDEKAEGGLIDNSELEEADEDKAEDAE